MRSEEVSYVISFFSDLLTEKPSCVHLFLFVFILINYFSGFQKQSVLVSGQMEVTLNLPVRLAVDQNRPQNFFFLCLY